MAADRKQYHVRLEPDLFREVKVMAAMEDRSLNAVTVHLIKKGLECERWHQQDTSKS